MSRGRAIPIRRLLILELLALTGLTVAVLLGLSWWALVSAMNAQGRAQARSALDQLDREIRLRMELAEHLGTSLAALWTRGSLDPRDPDAASRLLLPLVEAQPLLSVVVLVHRDGDGLFADHRSGRWSTTTLSWRDGTGTLQERFWNNDGSVQSVKPAAESPADFRERVWYRQAAESGVAAWTQPYVFKRLNVPGVTFAVPVKGGQGTLLGAIGVDFVLEDFLQVVWKMAPTPHSLIAITDRDGRALILPHRPELEDLAAREVAYLRPVSATFLPVTHAVLNAAPASDGGFRVRVDGHRYFADRRTFRDPHGLQWHLSLAIPEEDLLREPRRKAYLALGLAVLSLGILAVRIRDLADRFGTPLVKLARSSEALGRGERLEVPPSDIAEVQHLGQAIEVAGAALEQRRAMEEHLRHGQRLETLGTLAGGVAHDFNNLLTTILGYSELLLDSLRPQDPARPAIEEIQHAGRQAARLTRQLLAFSRKQVLEPTVLNPNAILSESEKMLRRLIGEHIRVVLRLAPDLGNVKADRGQLEQVLMNLAVNARDAMPKGGTLTIETANVTLEPEAFRDLAAAAPGRYAAITVKDDGLGMDGEVQKRLFEPFFTTKERGKGTGLGLSTAYGIVKQSGGHIRVESAPGAGSTFVVYLPIADGAEEPAPVEERRVASLRGSETILVVEDEAAVRMLVQPALEARGYRVLTAASGSEALELLDAQTSPVGLLLTDVVMPGMSGPELVEAISSRRGGPVKVLYMSGYTDDALGRHGVLEAGIQLISKPFTLEALARRVREVLDSRA